MGEETTVGAVQVKIEPDMSGVIAKFEALADAFSDVADTINRAIEGMQQQ
ncbi:hypothetical protein KIV64_gp52 [Mycobacterium phage DroogsArmy]|uniref:Uncharacterized protein n=1 Tax=Mycobacterium phage DroogsArmy TaxID=2744011 RepID=A0A6N0A3V4_9CAUD|nr:hypothetical protein KIV64_gp52 [Mycobacterium phage DroogsArmy]QKO02436.1 hypothetical protein SEA_DROOGSARMY_40 [Mycobacterium phage DroogsArmy]